MNKLLIFGLVFILSISIVYAIDSITGVPTEVFLGGSVTVEIDLASGVTEKDEPWNITFYNDTAQTQQITGCSFKGTTENAPDPINIVQECSIPSTLGGGGNGTANFTLTSLGTSVNFDFNISSIESSGLTISEFAFETPILLGKQTGARWTVTKSDTGNAVLGAACNGDILQSISGTLVPIAGQTGGFNPILSKYAGHALTSFIPDAVFLEEGTNYVVEVRCDCLPSATSCIDGDNNGIQLTNSTTSGLFGVGTTTISVGTWLTVNTVTNSPLAGESSFDYGDLLTICANVTQPDNRSRLRIEVDYNYRCGSGLDSDTDRVVIQSHVERRGINSNTTQMQCHDFIIPEHKVIEMGATECYGATDVSVLDEFHISIADYHTTSPNFNITPSEIHPDVGWVRLDKDNYRAKVNVTKWDVGIRDIEVILNKLLYKDNTPATFVDSFNVTYWNGTYIPYSTKLEVENELFNGETPSVIIYIDDVNTSKNETFNVSVTIERFEERTTEATEGIENKTGIFHLDLNCQNHDSSSSELMCTLTAYLEDVGTTQKEVDFDCFIDSGFSGINFNHMITRSPQSFDLNFYVRDLVEGQHTATCKANYYHFGSRQDSTSRSFVLEPVAGGTDFGGSAGARGGGCWNLAKQYRTCYYVNPQSLMCDQGCPNDFVCNQNYDWDSITEDTLEFCVESKVEETNIIKDTLGKIQDVIRTYRGSGIIVVSFLILCYMIGLELKRESLKKVKK